MSHSIEVEISHDGKCENCGRIVSVKILQSAYFSPDGRSLLDWEWYYICDCGIESHSPDSFASIPSELRKKILDNHGTWQLNVGENPPQREKLLVILLEQKRRLGFETIQKLPPISGIIAKGTFVEMKVLELYLLDAEIPCGIQKLV